MVLALPKSILGVSAAQIEDSLPLRSFLNGALFGEVAGTEAPTVVALHGWGRRGKDFASSLEGLDSVALDLPGFGASPAPDSVIGAEGYADIVIEFLEELDRPPVLVGHSFGGRVSVCIAARRPDLVGRMVLTGVPLLRSTPRKKPPLQYRLVRAMHRYGLVSDERMEALKRSRGSADYRAATGVMRDILVKVVNESYEEQMKEVNANVALVWGADDLEVPVDVARRATTIFPESSLVVLDGVGHWVPTQAPDELRAAIEESL